MFDVCKNCFREYITVLEPDRDAPDWWAGAPSVVRAPDGAFYMAARMREALSPPGQRGFEIRLLHSSDGIHFEQIHTITREAAGLKGFERPALVVDPNTARFRLYGCTPTEKGWAIIRFDDADDPAHINPANVRTILEPPAPHGLLLTPGYKDPFILQAEGKWHMYVIGIDRVERVHHFTSEDGDRWTADPRNPIFDNGGWHNFYTRPSCVLPMSLGYLFVYGGSNSTWHDPNYNIATGLAYTLDLSTITDLTPQEPFLISTTPGRCQTWRYSHWLKVDNGINVYAECARPNGSNEIRLFHIPG
ncbi:MAG TPA: hypothetical protein PLI09_10125 [Candidatus Hydrogenedentes bacterium]|nr:hypothetical protein [Candidatus Hydrogenedentota bacterium]